MSLYSTGGKILLLTVLPLLLGQTRVPAGKVTVSQVACGGAGGTKVSPLQIAGPNPCGDSQALSTAAWKVINTRCIKCHDYPEDTSPGVRIAINVLGVVGNLNLRTRVSILRGGNRGPAMVPGDLSRSLIYLFASRCQICNRVIDMGGKPVPTREEALATAQTTGFAYVPPDSNEDSVAMPPDGPLSEAELTAIRDWIVAGAP